MCGFLCQKAGSCQFLLEMPGGGGQHQHRHSVGVQQPALDTPGLSSPRGESSQGKPRPPHADAPASGTFPRPFPTCQERKGPCQAGTAPRRRCHGQRGVASQARRVCSARAGKGCVNVINYGTLLCHKQTFCRCSVSRVKFTARSARDDIDIINNCEAGTSRCCTSAAGTRESRARPRRSPGVICRRAGGVASAQGLAAGAAPGFYF